MSEYNNIIKENDNLYRDAAKGMLCRNVPFGFFISCTQTATHSHKE